MLTRPEITGDSIIACLRDSFGLRVAGATFLPIGADVDSAAFRVTADDGAPYFLKLRRGQLNGAAVAVPAYLRARGIRRVTAPLATVAGQLWVGAGGFAWMLYPYVEGTNGFATALSRAQWIALGETVQAVHATSLPAGLASGVPREDYGPGHRRIATAYDRQVRRPAWDDPVAAALAAFWTARRDEIARIVERAERLARALRNRPVDVVVCHGDLHAGNVLVSAGGELTIVDWDEPILAPKERDLMFVGGGVGGAWNQASEAAWFYEGYGRAAVDAVALAYYRYERIVVDIAAYAEQIFGVRGSAEDRREGLRRLTEQFLPGNVVEIAHRSYPYPA